MRKQSMTLLLGFMALVAFAPKAEAQWTKEKIQNLYTNFLIGEGLEGTIDSDGDVQFEYNERTYFLEVNEEDQEFFRLVLPNIWPIESIKEGLEVVQACDVVNRSMKCTKAYVTNDNVWVAVELFIERPDDFEGVFQRCLTAIENGIDKFVEEM